ncbi:Piso0_005097 [Millerozyma farinosa CBS 7064]|uniref:Piso0_005097 protein n=1 Tax=Pichia sorbitophila (strain ATCC MYA-4447 / BCRC 22081 / CBS 7064 / NBRC 10061 / NRRL Y-12695) TaxID=559304 RepID=G8Y481_PICSO|nr:Piso0_005097 [Millerozyma farinosa CBS 7064]
MRGRSTRHAMSCYCSSAWPAGQPAQRPLSSRYSKVPAGQVRSRTAYNQPLRLLPPRYLHNEEKHNNAPPDRGGSSLKVKVGQYIISHTDRDWVRINVPTVAQSDNVAGRLCPCDHHFNHMLCVMPRDKHSLFTFGDPAESKRSSGRDIPHMSPSDVLPGSHPQLTSPATSPLLDNKKSSSSGIFERSVQDGSVFGDSAVLSPPKCN